MNIITTNAFTLVGAHSVDTPLTTLSIYFTLVDIWRENQGYEYTYHHNNIFHTH